MGQQGYRPRRTGHGFTLVELLVALMVMALLSLMSWRGLDAMARAQERTQSRSDALQALHSGLAQWGADLDAMAADWGPPGNSAAAPKPLEWNGLGLRITRNSEEAGQSGLRVVAWSTQPEAGRKVWLRWQSPLVQSRGALQQAWQQAGQWTQNPQATATPGQVRIVTLVDWQVFYFRGDSWTNPASSGEANAAMPDAVRLQIDLPPEQTPSGRITRDWIRPTAVGAKS